MDAQFIKIAIGTIILISALCFFVQFIIVNKSLRKLIFSRSKKLSTHISENEISSPVISSNEYKSQDHVEETTSLDDSFDESFCPTTILFSKEQNEDFFKHSMRRSDDVNSLLDNAIERENNVQDYKSLFLVRKPSTDRSQCYISRYSYEKISQYLAVIGKNIPLTTYIDNVMRHHMEQYKEEINKLYEKNIRKPF